MYVLSYRFQAYTLYTLNIQYSLLKLNPGLPGHWSDNRYFPFPWGQPGFQGYRLGNCVEY